MKLLLLYILFSRESETLVVLSLYLELVINLSSLSRMGTTSPTVGTSKDSNATSSTILKQEKQGLWHDLTRVLACGNSNRNSSSIIIIIHIIRRSFSRRCRKASTFGASSSGWAL